MKWTSLLEEFYHNLPDEDRQEWFEERTLCDASLFYFIIKVGGSIDKAGGDLSPIIHKPICDFIQDNSILDKAVYMPRNWKKSTMRCWQEIWEYPKNIDIRILIASQKEERASDWLEWISGQILSNRMLRWLYPEFLQVDEKYTNKAKFSSRQVVLPRRQRYPDPTYRAIGVVGGAQGGHYDLLDGDDITGEKAMESELILEDAMRWVDNTKELLLDENSRRHFWGTHWARGDIGHYIQNEYPSFQWMIVPALKDEDLQDTENIKYIQNPNVEQGECNWLEMFPTEYYQEKMNNPQTQMIFWTQDQNNPNKAGGGLNKFDPTWLNYYHWEKRDKDLAIIIEDRQGKPTGEEYLLRHVLKRGVIDPSHFAETKSIKHGARCAVLIAGQPYETDKIILFYTWAGKPKEPSDFLAQIYKADKLINPQSWHMETFGGGEFMRKYVRQYGRKEYWAIKMGTLPKDVSKDAKDRRIAEVIPTMEAGKIYIHRKMKDLITEITNWPGGLTKDLIDALAWWHQEFYVSKKKERQATDKHERRHQFLKAKTRIGVT